MVGTAALEDFFFIVTTDPFVGSLKLRLNLLRIYRRRNPSAQLCEGC